MSADFVSELSGQDEIQIEFTKEDGKKRRIPVWFAVEGKKVELLPMHGLNTKWFIDVERSGRLAVSVGSAVLRATPEIVKDVQTIERIKKHFAEKYGDDDVRKYYPTSQVALTIRLQA